MWLSFQNTGSIYESSSKSKIQKFAEILEDNGIR